MTREIERLLNDHDNTYAQTMTDLKKRLHFKADLMMRNFDELLTTPTKTGQSNVTVLKNSLTSC